MVVLLWKVFIRNFSLIIWIKCKYWVFTCMFNQWRRINPMIRVCVVLCRKVPSENSIDNGIVEARKSMKIDFLLWEFVSLKQPKLLASFACPEFVIFPYCVISGNSFTLQSDFNCCLILLSLHTDNVLMDW